MDNHNRVSYEGANILTRICLFMLMLAVSLLSLAACEGNGIRISGSMTIVVEGETPASYTVELDNIVIKNGVISILDYLSENDTLEYSSQSSGYGEFITKIGGLQYDEVNNKFICIYTSVEKDFDVSEYAVSIEYEGKTLMSSGVGAAQMTIEKDCIIYFGLSEF